MVLALLLAGVVVLAASIWAWRRNARVVVSEMPSPWRALWRLRWLTGIALGIGSYFLRYSLDGTTDRYMVYGVPFMSYAVDQRGHDYVGPLTMPALALNFITWVMLPQLVLWAFTLRKRDPGPSNNGD